MRDENQQPKRVDLRVRTKQFALRAIRLFSALPKRIEAEVIGKQVLRSGPPWERTFGKHIAPDRMPICLQDW
jgi:hypothetical protein